jgi:prophage antirepressor-like protein
VSLEYHLTALKKIKKVEMIDKQWKSWKKPSQCTRYVFRHGELAIQHIDLERKKRIFPSLIS